MFDISKPMIIIDLFETDDILKYAKQVIIFREHKYNFLLIRPLETIFLCSLQQSGNLAHHS